MPSLPATVMPHVIMHDSVSIDGSFTGFPYSNELMAVHYRIAGGFGDRVRLIGATTALVSIEMFGGFTPEEPADFASPASLREGMSWWAITDSHARLSGKLHYFRRSEYCKDIIVLVSESTTDEYIAYLEERSYDYIRTGSDSVDLKEALMQLANRYQSPVITVDSGRALTNALLDQGLIDEISLLTVPAIVGEKAQNLFSDLVTTHSVTPISTELFPGGYIWQRYTVDRPPVEE